MSELQGITKIAAKRNFDLFHLHELIAYRELFYFFTWRDVKVRYKQTILGIGWTLLQPLITMIIFTLLFSQFVSTSTIPYPLFAITGLIPWLFASTSFSFAANCLMVDANLIKKIYFPLIILPISKILAGLIDLMLLLMFWFLLSLYYHITPSLYLLFFPCWLGVCTVSVFGISIYFSALTVLYRDMRFVTPFLVQIWMFISPIAYPTSAISPTYLWLYALNPLVAPIELFRFMTIGTDTSWGVILYSCFSAFFISLFGLYYFRKTERRLADVM